LHARRGEYYISWKEGNLLDLLSKGKTIQSRLSKSPPAEAEEKSACTFSNLMLAGKCRSALDLLSQGSRGEIIHLSVQLDPNDLDSPSAKEALISKHPTGQPAHVDSILQSTPEDLHPIIFEFIDAKTICLAAMHFTG